MAPTDLPVLWKEGDCLGVKGVLEVHQSDLQLQGAEVSDLQGGSRTVECLLLYGARLSTDRRLEAIIPDWQEAVRGSSQAKVADVKVPLQQMEGIAEEEQLLVFNNTRLEDHHTLESYNTGNGSLIYLIWKLKRGYIPPQDSSGTSDEVVQLDHEASSASCWRIAYEGLNVEGRCENEYGPAFREMVICANQFESFNSCGTFDGIRARNGLSISSPRKDASGD
ncbi:hypothetical protein PHYSODRAFT_330018 [Phytophthora sojae]|uniref:Ubiquitin-like domain-containing protein n=1 Tax=Phytophthora sojae (strain P6497) TaxID=1094619 RepID=G4Z2P4_PHYSP|nr:hypothetical protein PHYSODRAFT_330018 [Phytophthora sojae]EGZ22169.1 hypothetical protein PHYSODRAFT_330018 [Phytophthora sojae]|eukprot:XP_009524886.1 hypothetical protein PHYSODRAFT_330018 [Phytophthora sojae]